MKISARIVVTGSSLILFSMVVTGCGNGTFTAPLWGPIPGIALHGSVHGGQQPVSGASLELYAAGSTGYGSCYDTANCTSLFGNKVVTTDAGGSFNFTGDYTCPTAATEVFLVATGGNPGLGSGGTNPNLALMAALGPCGQLSASTFISVNELTTVASIWPLSPFMTGIAHIGTSGPSASGPGNAQGLVNAFASVNKLVNTASGTVYGPALPPGASMENAKNKLYTLADIVAACINSPGGNASDTSTPCGALFSATTVNGIVPTDTVTATMNLAQDPNNPNSAALIGVIPASAPFQPALTQVPADWSLVITYSGGGLSNPKGIAIDAAGNIWLPNAGDSSVTQLDALGVTASDATGFLSGASGYTGGSLNAPVAIAIDQAGNAWLANANNTISQLNANGAGKAVFSGSGLISPSSIAIDAASTVWVANRGNSSLTSIDTTGALTSVTGGGLSAPVALAIDPR